MAGARPTGWATHGGLLRSRDRKILASIFFACSCIVSGAYMPLAALPKCFLQDLCVSHRMSVDQWIDLSQSLDLDGLEFYWHFTPAHDPAELKRLRQRVAAQGRSIPMLCYSPDFTHPKPDQRRREIEQQQLAIRVAATLGARFCRVLTGQRWPEVSRREGIKWVCECINELLSLAEAHGVVLVLENHYKDGFWSYPEFAQRTDMFLEVLEGISPTPWFGVNYDPSNALIAGEDPIALLQAVKSRVVTMHASDRYLEGGTLEDLRKQDLHPQLGYATILKHGIIGGGLNDYDQIFSILRSAGFHGWISIEDGEDPALGVEHLRLSAEFLRARMRAHGLP
jgi:sugar phosphate isomerase/epimerase